MAQHGFGLVLRQPIVVGEIERTHQFALHPIIVIAAQKRAIGGDAADAIVARDGPRRAQRRLGTPEMEMLQRPLGQVLTLGYRLWAGIAFHKDAADAALSEFDRKAEADRPASDNEHLGVQRFPRGHFFLACWSLAWRRRLCCNAGAPSMKPHNRP
jgi:hypothetical protein